MSEERLEPKLRFMDYSNSWVSNKIDDVCIFVRDGTHGSFKDVENGIPLLSAKDISDGKIHVYEDSRCISIDDYNTIHKKYELEMGDILLTIVGTIGRTAMVDNSIKFTLQRSVAILRTNNNVSNDFVYYYIQSPNFQKRLKSVVNQSAQGGVYLNSLKKLKISISNDLNEQMKISDCLMQIDKKIELLEKKHQYYQDFKKYLMQQIFAQKLRFNNTSSYSEYKLKDIVTKFSTGLNPRQNFKLNEGGKNYYVTIKNFQNGILSLDDKCDKIDDDALKLINKRSDLQKDDLIFASIGRVGEVYLIKDNPLNWNINESVFSLRPNKQFIKPKLLYYLLSSDKVQHYFKSNITGSTFKSIKMKDLKSTPITIPDNFEQQDEIINFLTNVDLKIKNINNELNYIMKFKKGLLQQMFV